MTHTFLVEEGRWVLQGNWLERQGMPIPVKGKTLIKWVRDDWFTMVTKLEFPETDRPDISLQYRGRLDVGERQYTFVLQHSLLGKVEGEGWIAPESIVQRYWVLGDKERRSSFETLRRINSNTYHISSGMMSGYHLTSTMEAIIERRLPQKQV